MVCVFPLAVAAETTLYAERRSAGAKLPAIGVGLAWGLTARGFFPSRTFSTSAIQLAVFGATRPGHRLVALPTVTGTIIGSWTRVIAAAACALPVDGITPFWACPAHAASVSAATATATTSGRA